MNRPVETLSGWSTATARRVFIRDLEIQASVGVYAHEYEETQTVVVSIELMVSPGAEGLTIRYAPPQRENDPAVSDVVCYDALAKMACEVVQSGHIDYVETMAERIAERCLMDDRVLEAQVRIEKPQAIADARTAGVEILRRR